MASKLYEKGALQLFDGTTDWAAATIKVLLLKASGYTFDPTDAFLSDLTLGSNEATAAGYSRQTLTSCTINLNTASHRIEFLADDVTSFGTLASGETEGAAVVYDDAGGSDPARVPLVYVDPPDAGTNGGAYGLQWDPSGVFYIPLA